MAGILTISWSPKVKGRTRRTLTLKTRSRTHLLATAFEVRCSVLSLMKLVASFGMQTLSLLSIVAMSGR
jgi:hypothetical protein